MSTTKSSLIERTLQNRYKITNLLSDEGGFGITYRAIDTQRCNSHCVVKQLKLKNHSIARRLFLSEYQHLYQLNSHPQVPNLLAHFEDEEEFYLVQEFIDGDDLSCEIKDGRSINEKQAINLVKEILGILAPLHQLNLIHRDIKPSNIIRRNSDGKLILIDFGAVKKITSTYVENNQLTVCVGTKGYMPIEQEYYRKPTLASDIYAVGILGIVALLGTHPKNLRYSQNNEIIWRDRVNIKPEFADILDKMVHDNFRQRYQNASEALTDIIKIDYTSTDQAEKYSHNKPKSIDTLNENNTLESNTPQRSSDTSRSNWQKFNNFLRTWKYE